MDESAFYSSEGIILENNLFCHLDNVLEKIVWKMILFVKLLYLLIFNVKVLLIFTVSELVIITAIKLSKQMGK